MSKHRFAHKNDILVEDGWHVVRNERPYDMYGKKKKYIYFNVYHYHDGKEVFTGGMQYTGLCTSERMWLDQGWRCTSCQMNSPDIINGYMRLIEWSMSHDD